MGHVMHPWWSFFVRVLRSPLVIVNLAVLPLFQCANSGDLELPESNQSYRPKEASGNDDDRPMDEQPIGGQALGERALVKAAAPAPIAENRSKEAEAKPAVQKPVTPPPPTPTHLMQVTCSGTMMSFGWVFDGKTSRIQMSEPTACGQLSAALNGKSFPTGKTTKVPTGGATLKTSCRNANLTFDLFEQEGGATREVNMVFNLNQAMVCEEISNIINGLKV